MSDRLELTPPRALYGLVLAPALAMAAHAMASRMAEALDPAWDPHWTGRGRHMSELLHALPVPLREAVIATLATVAAAFALYLLLTALQRGPAVTLDSTGVTVRRPFFTAHMPWSAIRAFTPLRGIKPSRRTLARWDFAGSAEASNFGKSLSLSHFRISGRIKGGTQRDVLLFIKRMKPELLRRYEPWLEPQQPLLQALFNPDAPSLNRRGTPEP
jgi:hypothetical protein